MNDEKSTKSDPEENASYTTPPEKAQAESDDSLSLSLTPPILEDNKNDEKSEDISEHLTSNSDSIENDRSYQEIEITNRPNIFLHVPDDELVHTSQQPPNPLDNSACSDNSIISLNYLKNLELGDNVLSILDEILQNDQIHSDKDTTCSSSKEESLNIFANLDLDDKALLNFRRDNDVSVDEKNLYASNFGLVRNGNELEKRVRDFEELVAIKDSMIAVLTSELDSFREMSNANTVSTLSTTEYKQLQEECHSKLLEYNNVIVYKNDLIQQLTESLDQSVTERKELLMQIDRFKDEIMELQKQLQDTTAMVKKHQCGDSKKNDEVDFSDSPGEGDQIVLAEGEENADIPPVITKEYSCLEKTLNSHQKHLLKELKTKFSESVEQSISESKQIHEQEILDMKVKFDEEKKELDGELIRLRDLLTNIKCGSTELMDLKNELEAKHAVEMEELRTYFERKFADLEKNFSEEVFSQQSRKLSGSSCSELELNSDPIFPHAPGPSGDIRYEAQPHFTKKDVFNLQNELNSLVGKIGKYDLDDLTDDDLQNLQIEIAKSNLNNLLKYDLSAVTNEQLSKYQKELEIMQEDNENKLEALTAAYENKLRDAEEKYLEELEELKVRLDAMGKQVTVCSTVQEVGSSGEFEINEVIQSYERRLQEQVTLAKIDIITALETQIQRLATSENDDEEWPSELLRLRDKFSHKYEAQMDNLKKEHQDEIETLKEEHLKALNGALERARRRSLRDTDSLSKGELEMLRERDSLKKQVSSLRNLLGELLKYFTQCEDELNNTLVDELVKQGFDKNLSVIEDELNLSNSSPTCSSKASDSLANVTRVHLTPNFKDLINLIETSSQEDCDSKDISLDLKTELGFCLEKLKQEAIAILALTTNNLKQGVVSTVADNNRNSPLENKVTSLTRQLITETQAKEKLRDELDDALRYTESLEREKDRLESELDEVIAKVNILEADLCQAKNRIAQLIENGHKEIVSEGYGEKGAEVHRWGDALTILSELQEKARSMLSQSRASADPTLLQLIEELCAVGERIKEESQRENRDLQQQIEAADKKYRTTQKFLEEQAAEREQERDEAQKKMEALVGQLRERDKERVNCERVAAEVKCVCCRENRCTELQVEQLEHQLQEMTKLLSDQTEACRATELDRNEAVDKIKVLRDIIRELEFQTESKSKEIEEHLQTIEKLQCMLEQHERSDSEIEQGDLSKDVSDVGELCRHIEHLENELQKVRVQAELAGSEGALKQLYEIEFLMDIKTKELEALHFTTGTNCSSPSEDVSARDLIVPRSPKKMDDSDVPLQQLARLKEKLLRHSRAEDAAIKRIKDLEMQVFSLRQEVEESGSEKEYLKKQIQEQLVLISDFQIRLDEQRIRAEHIEKQTNTSLELKIYDLQAETASLREKLQQKEKALHQQQTLLEETRKRARLVEEELSSAKDDEIVVEMQKEIEGLRAENEQLKSKMSKDARMVPNLVENIISDKNVDIEKLRSKLDDTEKLLEAYTSLNLDRNELQTLSNMKNSGTSIEELFSIIEMSQFDQMRRMESRSDSYNLERSPNALMQKRTTEETVLEPEISAINGPGFAHSQIHARNSTEVSHKRVHFEDTHIEGLKNQIAVLTDELHKKEAVIKEYEERLLLLNSLESKIEKLQVSLEETEKALSTATETFEREQTELRKREKDLGVELAEKKLHLSEAEKRILLLEKDSQRKDEMYLELSREKKDLEKEISVHKHDSFVRLDTVIREKNEEIDQLKDKVKASEDVNMLKKQLFEKNIDLTSLRAENENMSRKLQQTKTSCETLEEKLRLTNEDNVKLKKELSNNALQIESVTGEMNALKEKLNKRRKAIRDLEDVVQNQKAVVTQLEQQAEKQKAVLLDRETEIEIVNEDAKHYQNEIARLEAEIKELKNLDVTKLQEAIHEKDLTIDDLNKERAHMLELMNEKEKIINQMAEDSHQLHVNLVTIKSKLKEPGNIIDIGNKLKEEQKRSAELAQEIHELKARLMRYKSNDMASSVDEITDQLRRELDYSAQIDSNIISAVSDQSINSISDSQDVEVYKKMVSAERASNRQISKQVDKLQQEVAELRYQLQKEREALAQTQADDAKFIEQLTLQLDIVLDREEALKSVLDEKKIELDRLEKEVDSMKNKQVNSSESTEYKPPPSKEVLELSLLRKDSEDLLREKEALCEELESLKRSKLEIDAAFRYTKELLTLEVQKAKNFEDEVRKLMNVEKRLRDTLKQKELEVEKLKDELDKDRSIFFKQKQELVERVKAQPATKLQENVLTSTVPDCLLEKIKELNAALLDNRKLMEIIQRVTYEKRLAENELANLKSGSTNNLPFNDLVARSDFLFAKTLKLESTKKALIWQKRYLMEHLQGHHQHCSRQASSNPFLKRQEVVIRRTPKKRFQLAVLVIVSIVRMKYLVQRWHSGIRIAEKVNSRHYRSSGTVKREPVISTRFQVGQPVSSQQFANVPAGNVINHFRNDGEGEFEEREENHERIPCLEEPDVNNSWSGKTPPSREKKSRICIGSNIVSKEDLTPLKAPQLIAHFVDRFDQIQERLGVVLEAKQSQSSC
ncbi:pericentrin-like protein isoform X2 [Leptinotarsa decemlineata]|uniref:pericentrin-like protein isoform X2 n=1 Tax=Leptinotarsa decemlineata TaxID=7539 RepID=UPI003D30C41B